MDEQKLEELFDRKLAGVNQKLTEMNTRLQTALDSVTFVSKQYDTVVQKLKEADVTVSSLRKELNTLSNTVQANKKYINDLEQYSRRDCVEIRGIPKAQEETSENTAEIVLQVAEVIGIELDEDDISACHRLPARKKPKVQKDGRKPKGPDPPAIIVKFISRYKRDKIYYSRSKLKDKSIMDLGYPTEDSIYIVESLTSANRYLFGKCLEARNNLGYKYIWTSQGKIMLRKENSSPAIHITSINDIDTKL